MLLFVHTVKKTGIGVDCFTDGQIVATEITKETIVSETRNQTIHLIIVKREISRSEKIHTSVGAEINFSD